MSNRIPTESRIFADRYFREARRLEAMHADAIAPGTKTWGDALEALFRRMERVGSPIKQAAILKQALAYLDNVEPENAMHIRMLSGSYGKRAAALIFATFAAAKHPLGFDEEGLRILQHVMICQRSGVSLTADTVLTYVSRHAMSRLHERDYRLTAGAAFGVFGSLGVLGLITRRSNHHIRGELCLRFNDILCVGSIKHVGRRSTDGSLSDGSFLDVRTVLSANDVSDQGMLDQGALAFATVIEWMRDRTMSRAETLAKAIPFRPRREDDFTLRSMDEITEKRAALPAALLLRE